MINFLYNTPTKVHFGKGTVDKVAGLLREQGAGKVLIHYGGRHVVQSGLLDRVIALIDEAGIEHVELGGVVANPHIGLAREGVGLAQREGVDFILAIGGGSVIDSAKAIGYGLANDCDPWEIYSGNRPDAVCAPVGCILTISAAGSEMSNSSVLTNEETHEKRGMKNENCRCRFAIEDPELTMTVPPYQTAAGCVDILMHTMERYFTLVDTMELTDSIAEGLMRTVVAQSKVLFDHPDDYDARAEIMWAGSLSHNNLTQCGSDGGDWASHQIEHEISGMFFDVTHGAGLAAVWGSWARYVIDAAPERFARFAREVWGVEDRGSALETGLAGVEAVEAFYRSIGMPTNMVELGVNPTDEEVHVMAVSCSFNGKRTVGCIKKLAAEDVEKIYRAALAR